MRYTSHGGGCCGYGHVYGFDTATPQHLRECITQHEAAAGGVNRILEAILTDRQLAPVDNDNRVHVSVRNEGGWAAILAREGFRLAAQWQNSNTGRNCYQFLRIPTLLTDTAGHVPPFNWTGEVVVAAPPPPVVIRGEAPEVGWTVRHRRTQEIGSIARIDGNLIFVRWEDRPPIFTYRSMANLERVIIQDGPAPAVIQRPVPVATEYYANLRVGGRRGPFISLAAAREAYPRCQRFDQRTIFSNGVSEYVAANQ